MIGRPQTRRFGPQRGGRSAMCSRGTMRRKFALLFPLILVIVSVLSQAPPHDMGNWKKFNVPKLL
jgi:hypothetical protein